MRKQHAAHNESVCLLLKSNGSYNDWVVTTAFYSALHYVQNEMFPLTIGTTTYNDFENYYTSIIRYRKSKHKTTIDLVQSQMPTVGPVYRWLHDVCMTARYKNYQISLKKSNRAYNNLKTIKSACVK